MTQRRGRKAGDSKSHASHSHAGNGAVAQEQVNVATSSSSLNDAPRAPGVERQLGPSHANGVKQQKRPRQVLMLVCRKQFLSFPCFCLCLRLCVES